MHQGERLNRLNQVLSEVEATESGEFDVGDGMEDELVTDVV